MKKIQQKSKSIRRGKELDRDAWTQQQQQQPPPPAPCQPGEPRARRKCKDGEKPVSRMSKNTADKEPETTQNPGLKTGQCKEAEKIKSSGEERKISAKEPQPNGEKCRGAEMRENADEEEREPKPKAGNCKECPGERQRRTGKCKEDAGAPADCKSTTVASDGDEQSDADDKQRQLQQPQPCREWLQL